ncbi:MAG: hypothetical protein GVY36_03940 [Verrucomicrobia bacterium]|nr:hypothetical protein [Verrucomicrobiota bacterium]
MHFLAYIPQGERFIVLLWGVLFAKCFFVKRFVRMHDVRVISFLYVWALSIFMAPVATIAFLRVRATERTPFQVSKTVLMAWLLCLAVIASLLAVA